MQKETKKILRVKAAKTAAHPVRKNYSGVLLVVLSALILLLVWTVVRNQSKRQA